MPEIFSHPAFLPAFIGLLGGVFISILFLSRRLSSLGAAAVQQEKSAAKTIANLRAEEAALKNELTTLRTKESRLVKRQGELETYAGNQQERRDEMAQFLALTKSTLQEELIKHESNVLRALRKTQTQQDDGMDFVPLVQPKAETPREKEFEGFVMEQPIAKAESAANDLRAALNQQDF